MDEQTLIAWVLANEARRQRCDTLSKQRRHESWKRQVEHNRIKNRERMRLKRAQKKLSMSAGA